MNETYMGEARIRVNAKLFQDFNFFRPDPFDEILEIVFHAYKYDNYIKLVADGYGMHKPEGRYGNGAIHCHEEDIMMVV
jgi:hypothetical protein